MKIKFLGAAQQVTGSCYALETGGLTMLVDCGLYQERSFLDRNWNPFPIPPQKIDILLLTHAHLDHCGLIPRLVKQGFSGSILTTPATADLLPIVLMDSAKIQEEDATLKKKRHQKEGRKGLYPEIPLYATEDVDKTLPLVEGIGYNQRTSLNDSTSITFRDAGHILGSSMIEIRTQENGKERIIIFSGDIGQWDKPIIRDPSTFDHADYVVMETTYGDRNHAETPQQVEARLGDVVLSTVKAGGNLVIPTFAIERAQELMFYLSRFAHEKRLPSLRVFLDSPMAVDVTDVFQRHPECLDAETLALLREGKRPFDFPGLKLFRTKEESMSINDIKGPSLIMAGSGMCTGGRIKHHLIRNISHPESTILFVGFQARETLGRQILQGNRRVRIFGQEWPVAARIEKILGFSAHADRNALFRWLDAFQVPPQTLFLTHGEKEIPLKLGEELRRGRGWNVAVPDYLEEHELN